MRKGVVSNLHLTRETARHYEARKNHADYLVYLVLILLFRYVDVQVMVLLLKEDDGNSIKVD